MFSQECLDIMKNYGQSGYCDDAEGTNSTSKRVICETL